MRPGGEVVFARYAYPPNALGLCGPGDAHGLLERAAAADDAPGLRVLARDFEGAWPYLTLIAGRNGVRDPLDVRVVESYWLGGPMADRSGDGALAADAAQRFAARGSGDGLADAVRAGARPTHAFHVFCVYPWVGLLRGSARGPAMHVLEHCRIRWGRVLAVDGDAARVRARPLVVDGGRLRLGPARTQTARTADGGAVLAGRVRAGDVVSMHWDWVCDTLTPRALRALRETTALHLAIANSARAVAEAA